MKNMSKVSIRFLYLPAFIFFLSMSIMVIPYTVDTQLISNVSSITVICLEPQTCWGVIGQNFTVDIEISDVADLYGWEFKLSWNASILDAAQVLEGPFLKNGGNTYFTSNINNTLGYMIVDCTLLGTVPGVSGNGVLASAIFYVETFGECPLDLYDTILVNSTEQPIEHTAVDGYYYTSVHDVAVVNLVASASSVNVTVENQGTHTETFNVSAYYTRLTDPLIGTQTVTLERGSSSTLIFAWTPPTYGRYEIRAEASTVLGEVDTADNSRTIIVHIGYGGSSFGVEKGESLNGYPVAICLFALLLPFTMLTFRKSKEISMLDIPAALLKETVCNKSIRLDSWQIWIKDKVRFKLA